MKVVSATEFKHHCLALLKELKQTHETLLITKHGKPVAQVLPYTEEPKKNPLKDSILFENDLVSPIAEPWDVDK